MNNIKILFSSLIMIILLTGCAKKALPMTKAEVLAITHGEKFNAAYYAEWSGYSYKCSRMDDDMKKIFNTLWTTGQYNKVFSSWELYLYQYGRVIVKNVASHDRVYFFESSRDCERLETVGGSPSIDVYVH